MIGLGRLRGMVAARSLRARVFVSPAARLGRGVRIAVAPGGEVRIGAGCRIERRARLEAGPGRVELAGRCRVGERSRLAARAGAIELGPGASVGERCTLIAHAGIAVGEEARLGDGVTVIDFEPVYGDSERPIREQGVRAAAVRLGARVVVGPRAAIGAGTSLAAGAQVAAGTILPGAGAVRALELGPPRPRKGAR
jgi:acetyltransferase-like isoleucine patch superfamily enzyme